MTRREIFVAPAATVRLVRAGAGVKAEVSGPAPVPMGRILLGRTPEEAARMVPLMWNLCAAAQAAGARAALGLPVSGAAAEASALEMLRETAMELSAMWPTAARLPADPEVARMVFDGLGAAPGIGERLAPPGALESLDRFEKWARKGRGPAAALASLLLDWPLDWGRIRTPLLDPERPIDWTAARQDGEAVENGPALRHPDSDLLDEINEHRGRGPLWRLAARLLDLDRLAQGAAPFPLAPAAEGSAAHAARGLMLMRARLVDGRVDAFERLSPTDFALAADGPLAKSLETLPFDEHLAFRARMIVHGFDPCLKVKLEVADA